jgi:hypothetical protein
MIPSSNANRQADIVGASNMKVNSTAGIFRFCVGLPCCHGPETFALSGVSHFTLSTE